MASASFLSIPITIREQIFDELLTAPAVRFVVSSICRVLLVNRQLYHEVIGFLGSKLLILIQTNDAFLLRCILQSASFPIISQLKLRPDMAHKDTTTAPIAMKIEFHVYETHERGLASYPIFLIPASSLRDFQHIILGLRIWEDWSMRGSLSFRIVNTFTYTRLKAEELLIGPWLDFIRPVKLAGIETDTSISEALTIRLRKSLVAELQAEYLFRKLDSLRCAALEKSFAKQWGLASERYHMAHRYATLLWDCHLACLRNDSMPGPEQDFILQLWIIIVDEGANHIDNFLNAASEEQTNCEIRVGCAENSTKLLQARHIGEEIIKIQSIRQPFAYKGTLDDDIALYMLRKSKAGISFALFKVCQALGDGNATTGYLQEYLKYEPDPKVKLRLEEWVAKDATDAEAARVGVVNWDMADLYIAG